MIDVYHCPMCSRLLKCEGVVSIGGHELPMFQCEDCLVKKAVFGPGTEEFEMAYTFCVDSAGRCFDPVEELGESDEDRDCDDDSEPDPVDVHLPNRERNPALKPIQFLCHAVMPMGPKVIAGRILDVSCWGDFRGCWPIPGIVSAEYEERTEAIIGSRIRVRNGDGSTHVEEVTAWIPDRLVRIRLDDFSAPLKWLTTHFTETWQFERDSPAATQVSRMFELQPVSVLTWPAVWVLSRCLRRAVCRHLREMAAG